MVKQADNQVNRESEVGRKDGEEVAALILDISKK